MEIVKITNLSDIANLPKFLKKNQAFALIAVESVLIKPSETKEIRTGLVFNLPNGLKPIFASPDNPREFSPSLQFNGTRESEIGEILVSLKVKEPEIKFASSYLHHVDGKIHMYSSRKEFEEGSYIIHKGDVIAHCGIKGISTDMYQIEEIKPIDLYRELLLSKKA